MGKSIIQEERCDASWDGGPTAIVEHARNLHDRKHSHQADFMVWHEMEPDELNALVFSEEAAPFWKRTTPIYFVDWSVDRKNGEKTGAESETGSSVSPPHRAVCKSKDGLHDSEKWQNPIPLPSPAWWLY